MPRPTAEEIQAKIQAALAQEVAQKGIGSVSVGHIAKRAGVSPGTIYLHFENKEDMLQKIFLKLKTELHGAIVAAENEKNSAKMIRKMWFALFEFASSQPFEFLFLEAASAAQVLTEQQSDDTAHMQLEIDAMLQRGIDDGTLADLPVSTVVVLLVAPAMYLARSKLLNREPITQDEVHLTFDRVWLSIASTDSTN